MKLTKNIINSLWATTIILFALTSCITEESIPNNKREKISLEAWIKLNKPELVGNYQEEGGYYVEILEGDTNENIPISSDGNDFGSEPLMDQDTCWVYTNMTGRDINGAICMTRSGSLAEMCGTFSYSTHYVPYINYCGNNNMGLLEGTYIAMRHEFTLSDDYCDWYYAKYNQEIEKPYKMRRGSKVRLYLPSSIAYGESGTQTEGGYEGQYSLDASRPLVLDIEVLGAIKNPSEKELAMLKSFVGWEGEWKQATKPESEKVDEKDDLILKGLYYNHSYNPKTDDIANYRYLQPHLTGLNNPYKDNKMYSNMTEVNRKINDILFERFGKGLEASERNEKNLVTKNGRANVWYVLRFLDGFVVDSNIEEIRRFVFNEQDPVCDVFSYSPSDDEGKGESERQAIGAWFYCIPEMHYGAYGQIATSSGYAYGAAGLSGTTTTETSSSNSAASYYNAMNYYNYYNSYYNSYYNPYYNYYDYNYYNFNYNTPTTEEVTTKTTISTEILPYTPLVFTIFVEPN